MDRQSAVVAGCFGAEADSVSAPEPMRSDTGTSLSRGSIMVLAAACGLAVANTNYVHPLLVDIGRSLALSDGTVGLIPALTQLGVSAGILFLLPLGDIVPAQKLLTVAIAVQAIALFGIALTPDGSALLALSLLVGFFGITP